MGDCDRRLEQPSRPDPRHGCPRQRAGHRGAWSPLANMFGYVNTLRSMTQGRAAYTMTFDHYAVQCSAGWWRTRSLRKLARLDNRVEFR